MIHDHAIHFLLSQNFFTLSRIREYREYIYIGIESVGVYCMTYLMLDVASMLFYMAVVERD